ncbi:MAG: SufS family cysteine desulfurase [Ruminococcus sp.]|nr:SufS family cysteine desulfurase [Ruminococcus sp.]
MGDRTLLLKEDFPVFKAYPGLVYLDNSATQQKPESVLRAVDNYYRQENANPMRGLYDLSMRATEAYEGAREAVRAFINAKSVSEIIFTRNATESLNLAAYSLGRSIVGEGDEILITIAEHHSDLLPWQLLAKEKGAKLRYLECDEEGLFTEEGLRAALTDRTKIFAFTHISNVLGRINDVKGFVKLCRENGTVTVCDGAQSVAHIPVDVRDLGVDLLAFSGHKMLGPMGIGVLYGREELLEKMPPFLSGGEMIEYVSRDSATYAPLPHKFEAGTVNAGGAVGLRAAIEYINDIGFDLITRREEELTRLCFEEMSRIPFVRIMGGRRAEDHCGIITFDIEGVHPHDVAAIMDSKEIAVRAGHHCAQPLHKHLGIMSSTRVSFAFYNTEEDVMRFIAALKQVRRMMGYGE